MGKCVLDIWVIYENQVDYPGEFVARKFQNEHATKNVIRGASLFAVREQLPKGLVLLPRNPLDEPQIVEVWL